MDLEERKENAWKAFCQYLENRNGRKTPERKAVLDVVFEFNSHFAMDELSERMKGSKFHVSRATLYNTMRDLQDAGIVSKLQFGQVTRYEVSKKPEMHFHQVCSICGKITDFQNEVLDAAIKGYRAKRFTIQSYSLHFQGICASCQSALRKQERKNNKNKKK